MKIQEKWQMILLTTEIKNLTLYTNHFELKIVYTKDSN
jgi:hypothetical protein